MKPVRLHPEAQEELNASEHFYLEKEGAKLALQFVSGVERALRVIQSDPQRFTHVAAYPKVQKSRLRRFPFSIFYIERVDDIWVIAIAHAKRHPTIGTGYRGSAGNSLRGVGAGWAAKVFGGDAALFGERVDIPAVATEF